MQQDWKEQQKDENQDEQNLIQQFIIYGVLNIESLTIEEILNNQMKVGVLQHYSNRQNIFKEDQHQFYQMWAYPDGIKIYDTRLNIINDKEPQHSFNQQHNISIFLNENTEGDILNKPHDFIYSFVHTDYELNRSYFTALCWHEKKYCPINKESLSMTHNRNIYSHRLPKCTLWELQNDPLMRDFNKQLVYVPKVILISSKYPLFLFQRQILKFYYRNVLNQTNDLLINQQEYNNFKQLIQLIGFPEAQSYYDSQRYKKLSKKSKIKKYKRIPKQNLNQFYTSFFFLPKLKKSFNQIQIVDCYNSSIKFTPIFFNKNMCFYRPNIDLLAIIKKIGINNLISLWKSMILQRHILIFSMNNINIIQLCQTLFYLLQPIRWENIYIPFLPVHLVNNVDAIQSYIIGMSKIHMDYVISHFKMKDIILFDFDNNVIIENCGKSDIELPTQIFELISLRLQPIFLKKQNILYFFKHKAEEIVLSQQQKVLRVKQIFFDALLYLLNNYRSFSTLDENNLLNFDREGYKKMFTDKKWCAFTSQLVNTMIFIRLCEYHLYKQKILKWNQYSIGGFFVYCQNILSTKFKEKAMWQVPKPQKDLTKLNCPYYEYLNYVLNNDIKKLNVKEKYQIQHYLIKYLNYQQLVRQEESQHINVNPQGNKKGFFNIFIGYLFPWLEQIEKQCKKQNRLINQRSSNKFSINKMYDLECIFGEKKQAISEINIEKLFSQHKQKKNSYLNYNRLLQSKHRKQRISV